jgi:hypothetical protein
MTWSLQQIKTDTEHKQIQCCQQQQQSSSSNDMEDTERRDGSGESCTLPAAATRTRDMGAKFLVTVSSRSSPACTSVAPLAQLECSVEKS